MSEDFMIFIVMIVGIFTFGGIIRRSMELKHKRAEASAQPTTKHDYNAWKEGQKATERNTKKEIELYKMKKEERDAARETYERIVKEKLDVMRTAISMGMEKDAIEELDKRLEKLIGQDKLERLLDEDIKVPQVSPELRDSDLESELDRLTALRKKHANL